MHGELAQLAQAFRAAIERADQGRLPLTMQSFPRGACGDAALLLAKFLEEHGHAGFDYVGGRRGDGWHYWLQRGALVIDIAADQFPEMAGEPVVVSDGSGWHAALGGVVEHPADFTLYDDRATWASAYRYLCTLLPAHSSRVA